MRTPIDVFYSCVAYTFFSRYIFVYAQACAFQIDEVSATDRIITVVVAVVVIVATSNTIK